MAAAFVEFRPRSSSKDEKVSHYVIVVGGEELHGTFETQKEAKEFACKRYTEVHVARVRHLQDKKIPDHWRKDPC